MFVKARPKLDLSQYGIQKRIMYSMLNVISKPMIFILISPQMYSEIVPNVLDRKYSNVL